MKNIFLKLSIFSVAFLLFACSDTDQVIDDVFANTTSGGILRTLEATTELPIGLADAGVELLLEIQDEEDGDLSDRINVYASFSHLTGGGANDRDEALLKTITSDQFILGERLPRALVTATLTELQALLNLGNDDFTGGDRFIIRVELVFKDGRTWSNNNASQSVLGNAFFASPFAYDANVICPVPEDYFVGTYLMERTSAGEDPFFPDFGQAFSTDGQIVTITANGTQRNFEFSFFPDSFDFGQNMQLTFLCGQIEVLGTAVAGTLGCGNGSIGQATAVPPSGYDLSDDSVVIVDLLDFEPDAGCETGNYAVTLRFTKQ